MVAPEMFISLVTSAMLIGDSAVRSLSCTWALISPDEIQILKKGLSSTHVSPGQAFAGLGSLTSIRSV